MCYIICGVLLTRGQKLSLNTFVGTFVSTDFNHFFNLKSFFTNIITSGAFSGKY